ncbi:MAG: hypothetical protein IT422_06210 [Pirellulaceae bacterium]|nr:hypothetical protein [Pirellulaceae bacterium]
MKVSTLIKWACLVLFVPMIALADEKPSSVADEDINTVWERLPKLDDDEIAFRHSEVLKAMNQFTKDTTGRRLTETEEQLGFWLIQAEKAYRAIAGERKLCVAKIEALQDLKGDK